MNARSLMALSRDSLPGMTSLSGYTPGGGMNAKDFQKAAGSVSADDLREIGVASNTRDPFDAAGTNNVDPARMKFDAMMALRKAQQSGLPTDHAQQQLQDADLFSAGRDEVLRRRQGDFNAAAAAPQPSDRYGDAYDYMRPDPKISGLTGAAVASQARAGRPQQSMPQEQHDPIFSDVGAGLGRGSRGLAPYTLTSADARATDPMRGLRGARTGY